ncbi:MAG: hypothetical protein A2817_00060 [Candidatus Yanofskybacteria bacterium RIFCSPHIGHO2_01_FULL_39_8b]|uniref:Methyltransferase domain-containing protein n=1 Tax=Candidatus Yanofskybacteria bacterium RIFCSPHIGHO2_01_FULL_39_8b TaxID=1802659 RepID=A0A1F8ECG1_9BACT|nr:MAG: hypothetical protein A2817_00060 [Candidatus Yanofskybacteria bacterium RIFCSPHIGHO2_01_FULL_39_8b]
MMTSPDNFEKRKEKWENKQDNRADSVRQATFILTVKNALELLSVKSGKVLDIGCGFGELAILLARNTDFEITGFDISKPAVEVARENVRKTGLEDRIKVEEGDVYCLKYDDCSFDVVVSFGYVSAATYRGAQKEIARVLKPGGILICDFINCLSFYKIFSSLIRILKKNSPYYLSLPGIRREFEKEGLIFKRQRFFNTYPPLNLNLSPRIFLAFENTLGWLLKRCLARVRLVCFLSIRK